MSPRKSRCLALLVLASALLLCSTESLAEGRRRTHRTRFREKVSAGSSTRHLHVGGLDRTYLLNIPRGLSKNKPVQLILAFHGGGGDSGQFASMTNLSKRAGKSGFVVAYPQGFGNSWNAGNCCGPALAGNIDDVAFVRAILTDVGHLLKIDSQRVFATGFSNGDMFSYRLACEMSDRIAAIAVSSAPLDLPPNVPANVPAATGLPTCAPRRPVPILHVHGLADTFAPFEGGPSVDPNVGILPSIPATIEFWVARNGCTNETRVSFHHGAASCVTHPNCQAGTVVTLCTIELMGHQWAGGEVIDQPLFGPGSNALIATKFVLDFFRAHPMPH
jgi:polyhydroxybutyrate depolymerase